LGKFNQLLDHLSDYFAHRKGLLPIVGLIFVVINLILQLIPGIGWLASLNIFLHFGIILAIIGILLAWVL
jgi:hypothetical protein